MDNSGALVPVFRDGMPYDRNDRVRVWKIEEKKTDVNRAMAMYRYAAKGLYDQVLLCSNDSDAEPVLQALREDFPALVIGVVTPAWHRRTRLRAVLEGSAHRSRGMPTGRDLLDGELTAAQLPPRVPTNKKPIVKPLHW